MSSTASPPPVAPASQGSTAGGASRSRFARVARWCATHRTRTILAWLVGAVAITVLGQVVGVKEISSFRLPGTESQSVYDTLDEHFPAQNGDADQIVFKVSEGKLSDRRPAVDKAVAALEAEPIVRSVSNPLAKGGQLSEDGTIGAATVTYKGGVDDFEVKELQKVEDAAFDVRAKGLQVEHGGLGAETVRFGSGGGSSEFIGIAAAAIVLFITFGSLLAAGMPLASALFALVTTLGGITLISHVLDTPDFATQLATLIGLGVGVDYALFVVTRYKTVLADGHDRLDAIEIAADTAGRTVFFAACTVVIALLGMLLLGLNFLQGVAVGAALAVALTMVAALTLLPAFLSLAGKRIDSRRRRKNVARGKEIREGHLWERWSLAVQRRPWPAAVVSLAILLALCAPALGLRLGSSDASLDPSDSSPYKAYQLISDGFGPGVNGTYLTAVTLPQKGDAAAAQQVADAIAKDPGIASVSPPQLSPDGVVATLSAVPKTGPQDAETTDTLKRLRADVLPAATRQTGAKAEVGGLTASNEDFTQAIADKLPLFIGAVVLLSALLLLAVFRSAVIPVKAALMNLLSIGASLGVVTLIFQEGYGADLLGIGTGPIEPFVPILVFAIVFGLSMDYEIFLISRVQEEFHASGDASSAVARGVATTGRVITAAAAIMVVVFASFALGDDRIIKLFGIGLASAIFIDALIIRCLLVPALMEILGRAAWFMPSWLDRIIPKLDLERSETPAR